MGLRNGGRLRATHDPAQLAAAPAETGTIMISHSEWKAAHDSLSSPQSLLGLQ